MVIETSASALLSQFLTVTVMCSVVLSLAEADCSPLIDTLLSVFSLPLGEPRLWVVRCLLLADSLHPEVCVCVCICVYTLCYVL